MVKLDHDRGPRIAILNVVGLCKRHLGEHTPKLTSFAKSEGNKEYLIRPVMPAVTCSVQSTYLTGKLPTEHGIVGNGWYDRELNEHQFWKQSNKLVQCEKLWDSVKKKRPNLKSANLFWWYNMYSNVDFSITPRPLYRSDGLKAFDIHSHPLSIRCEIKQELGNFPFPAFWGPKAGISSSQWIADAARWVEKKYHPDLNLIYLPHLDYDFQRYGPSDPRSLKALAEIDQIAGSLIDFFSTQGVECLVLSEYGITEVSKVIYPNRIFRHQGWLNLKEEFGLETLDSGGSQAFALTDHQIAHIYLPQSNPALRRKVRSCLESMDGVATVFEGKEREMCGLNHQRAGDLVALAEEDAWFAYYFWEDDELAPEFARCIDIHRKHGYDPVELFVNPEITFPTLIAARKLLAKKLGFRIHMDFIPLNPYLVKGSHGAKPKSSLDWPVLLGKTSISGNSIESTTVHEILMERLLSGET